MYLPRAQIELHSCVFMSSFCCYLASNLCGISWGVYSRKAGKNILVTSFHCKVRGLIGRDSEQVKYCSNIEAEGQRPRKHCECALAQIVGLNLLGDIGCMCPTPPEPLSPFPARLQSSKSELKRNLKALCHGSLYDLASTTRKCVSIQLQND
jgi:hypothetical protein